MVWKLPKKNAFSLWEKKKKEEYCFVKIMQNIRGISQWELVLVFRFDKIAIMNASDF